MTDISVKVLGPEDMQPQRNPTVAERLRSLRVFVTDETKQPKEGQDVTEVNANQIVFIRNFRGFQQGRKGRRNELSGRDVIFINGMPDTIPLDEIDEFCDYLRKLRDAGVKTLAEMKPVEDAAE